MFSDPDDPRLDDIRDLRRQSPRRRESAQDWFVVEGLLALQRAVAAGHRLRGVVVTPAKLDAVAALDLDQRIPVHLVTPGCLREVTGFDAHRGVLASASRPTPLPLEEVLAQTTRVVLVEGVNDLENLGAIFRVAAGLGFGGALLDPLCADPLYRRCVRVSLGWSCALPHAVTASSAMALAALKGSGFRTVALTPSTDAEPVDLAARDGHLDDPLALIVGAEGPGLQAATLAAADHRVRIPMQAGVDSLNVATALAVVGAFAAARRDWQA